MGLSRTVASGQLSPMKMCATNNFDDLRLERSLTSTSEQGRSLARAPTESRISASGWLVTRMDRLTVESGEVRCGEHYGFD